MTYKTLAMALATMWMTTSSFADPALLEGPAAPQSEEPHNFASTSETPPQTEAFSEDPTLETEEAREEEDMSVMMGPCQDAISHKSKSCSDAAECAGTGFPKCRYTWYFPFGGKCCRS